MGNNSINTSWSRSINNLNNTDDASSPTPAPAAGVSRPQARPTSYPSDAEMQSLYDALPERHFELPTHIPKMDPQAERIEEAKRAADAKVQAKLDAVHNRFSGPYKVDGKSVPARPMFRMNVKKATPAEEEAAKAKTNDLVKICQKAHVPGNAINNACVGRPTPEQLVQVTQALINAGKLPPPKSASDTVEMRIRQMQYKWGIGVDCAGYVNEAAVAVHGKGAQSLVSGANRYSDIYAFLQTRAFQKVAGREGNDPKMHNIRDIRAGDIIHLDPVYGNIGHNVIVHKHEVHEVVTDSMRAELAARGSVCTPSTPKLNEFLNNKGPFHVLEVDSSWGAGPEGRDYGGFRRDTWVYDESSENWGYFSVLDDENGTREFTISKTGPQDEKATGAYRPASAK